MRAMRQDDLHFRTGAERALSRGLSLVLSAALLAGCDAGAAPGAEVQARLVEPAAVLARLGAAEALSAAAPRESPSAQTASYYARRASGEAAAPEGLSAEEEGAEEWPPSSLRAGGFSPQALPTPPGGVAATRLFASPDLEAAPAAPEGGFIRSEAAPFQTAALGAPPGGAPLGTPMVLGGSADPAPGFPGAASSGGVAALGVSRRDPFQDFLEALHNARSGDDLRAAAETLAMEATAPAALTLAGSFENESPDVAVAVYDALWRVRNLPEAARRMGLAARDGRGVAQDLPAAAAYFREASSFGDLQARRLLEDLERQQAATEY